MNWTATNSAKKASAEMEFVYKLNRITWPQVAHDVSP